MVETLDCRIGDDRGGDAVQRVSWFPFGGRDLTHLAVLVFGSYEYSRFSASWKKVYHTVSFAYFCGDGGRDMADGCTFQIC
jgi:hypothetical protein